MTIRSQVKHFVAEKRRLLREGHLSRADIGMWLEELSVLASKHSRRTIRGSFLGLSEVESIYKALFGALEDGDRKLGAYLITHACLVPRGPALIRGGIAYVPAGAKGLVQLRRLLWYHFPPPGSGMQPREGWETSYRWRSMVNTCGNKACVLPAHWLRRRKGVSMEDVQSAGRADSAATGAGDGARTQAGGGEDQAP